MLIKLIMVLIYNSCIALGPHKLRHFTCALTLRCLGVFTVRTVREAVAEVLDSVPADSTNPWHTTICTRTKRVMDRDGSGEATNEDQ